VEGTIPAGNETTRTFFDERCTSTTASFGCRHTG